MCKMLSSTCLECTFERNHNLRPDQVFDYSSRVGLEGAMSFSHVQGNWQVAMR